MEISLSLAKAREYSKYCYLDQENKDFYQSRLNSVLDNLESHISCFQFSVNGLLKEKNIDNFVYVPSVGLDLVDRLVREYSNYLFNTKNEHDFQVLALKKIEPSQSNQKIPIHYQEPILQFLEKLPLELLSNSFNNLETVKTFHYQLIKDQLLSIKEQLKKMNSDVLTDNANLETGNTLIEQEKLDQNNPNGYGIEELDQLKKVEQLLTYTFNGKKIDLNFADTFEKISGKPLIEVEDDQVRISKLYKKDQIK